MSEVTLTPSGPPETTLPAPDSDVVQLLARSMDDLDAVAHVVADHPDSCEAWAALGEALESKQSDGVERTMAYGAFRVGYHRGLDALRKHGWRGSGFVRWAQPSNRGFLRCLDGLRRMAGAIGETSEEQRCAEFLRMLDPDWDRRGS